MFVPDLAPPVPRLRLQGDRGLDFDIDSPVEPQALTSVAEQQTRPAQSLSESLSAEDIPYGSLIRELIAKEQISVARQLIEIALRENSESTQLCELRRILAPGVVTPTPEADTDRRLEYEWLMTSGARYRGQWVALAGSELLTSAVSLRELLSRLRDIAPATKPLIHRIP
jgi:hypothetical protein